MADEKRKLTHTAAELDAAVEMLLEMYTREEIDNLLSQKITESPGKGLSTNDFTDADKNKLDGLENYDDVDVKEDIAKISSQAAINKTTLGYQSKNLLKYSQASKTSNGITYTVNEDMSITVNGTATANSTFVLVYIRDLSDAFRDALNGRKLVLAGCPAGGSSSTYRLNFYRGGSLSTLSDFGSGVELDFSTDGLAENANFAIVISSGNAVNNLKFYPMLRYADITDDTYEPYKPSVEERLAALEAAIMGGGET